MKASRSVSAFVLCLLLCASAPCPAAIPAQWASRAGSRPLLVLIQRPGDVAALDAAHWLREDPALHGPLARLYPVILRADDPAVKSLPDAPRGSILFLSPGGEPIAAEEIPARRAGLRPLLAEVLADPRPADALAQAAAASPTDTRLVERAVAVQAGLEHADRALALLKGALPALGPGTAQQATASRWRTRIEELEVQARTEMAGRLRGAMASLEALRKALGTPAGPSVEARAQAAGTLDACAANGMEEDPAFTGALAETRAALAAAAAGKAAASALDRLLPLLKARADALRRKAQALQEAQAQARPESLKAQARRLRGATDGADRGQAAEERAKTLVHALLARPMPAEELLHAAGALADAVILLDLAPERAQLAAKLRREAPAGRDTALALLDLADEALAQGSPEDARRDWEGAIRAAESGESPTLLRTARAMRALLDSRGRPARAAWARRRVLDVVVLVPDLPTFAAAVSRWSDSTFFPVLFQDDLYAPKFIDAFKPARVIIVPPGAGTPGRGLTAEELRAALLASWTSQDAPAGKVVTDKALKNRLRALRLRPPGVVFTDGASGETAGALALAAGRFQGLAVLPSPRVGKGADERAARPGDSLSHEAAEQTARQVRAEMARWGLPEGDAWSAITLAGAYPYTYSGEAYGQWGSGYALDDLLGRDEEGLRTAAVGRLLGDPARSAYQAACSLFLRPDNAFLFNTYGTNPRSIWGFYRMDFSEARWKALLPFTHLHDAEANIDTFRARTLPWNRQCLVTINSSGGATGWSVGGGGGNSDDFPVGGPAAIHVTHSGSAANPYDPDTLAGRAVWGGAFFYFGSTSEPFLSSFQPPRYYAPRIAAGAPLAATFRRRAGQEFWQPWRLMIVGDPLFCLREAPAARVPYRPGVAGYGSVGVWEDGGRQAEAGLSPAAPQTYADWLAGLRQARWRGDHAAARSLAEKLPAGTTVDQAGLAMALEEALIAGDPTTAVGQWKAAGEDARKGYAARVYARQAAGALMDRALAAKDLPALLASGADLLTTGANPDFVTRWLSRMDTLARERKEEKRLADWLSAQLGGPQGKAYEGCLSAAAKKLGQ